VVREPLGDTRNVSKDWLGDKNVTVRFLCSILF